MTTAVGASDIVVSAASCRQLLASSRVARVAFVDDGLPQLVVMNYLLDGDGILLQTSADTRLAARTSQREIPVLLEVDSVSSSGRFGWSVIAAGSLAQDVSAPAARLPVPWRVGATGVALRLTIRCLSGRQVSAP